MRKSLSVTALAMCAASFSCRDSAKNYRVEYVGRNAALSFDKTTNPLLLVVEIGEDGQLSLNKIETGTIADPAELNERLRIIFEDRKKSSINERAVIVEPHGRGNDKELKTLTESLAKTGAAPILLVAENPSKSIPEK